MNTLPPDQQAVLSLLLKQGKSYDDIGALLHMDRETVRWRAHSAVGSLAPPAAADAPTDNHWQVIDYLLGQQTASERAATRELLESSAPDRAWARAVATELRPLAGDELPEIPAEAAEVDRAFEALGERDAAVEQQAKTSRIGSYLLLGGLALALAVVVVLLISGGSPDKPTTTAAVPPTTTATTPVTTPKTATTPATSTTTSTTTTAQTTTKPVVPPIVRLGSVNLAAPSGQTSPIGAAQIVKIGSGRDVNIVATGLPPGGSAYAYAVWLVGAKAQRWLGFTPLNKPGAPVKALAPLPDDMSPYTKLLITKETTSHPTKVGTVVLQGALPRLP